MALCLASSLGELGRFDPADQLRRYCRWYETGYLSSTGRCFDIGLTVRSALLRFQKTGEPFSGSTDPQSAGNGCIMRLAPVPIFFYPQIAAAIRWAGESARTTHGAPECIESCQLLAAMLCAAFSGAGKEEVLFGHDQRHFHCPKVRAIAVGDYRQKNADAISGSGYVIHCLEAAAWCFWQTSSFREAVLLAANLGDDADTTGAVCGQIAGAFYGEDGIPQEWLSRLVMVDEIRSLANRLTGPQTDNQARVVIPTANLDLVLQTPAEVLAWVETLSPADRAEVSPHWLEQVRAATPGDPWRLSFIVRRRADGKTVGGCAFKGPPNAAGIVEVAYGMEPPYRGHGYATEAAAALTAFAFASGLVRVVCAHTKPDNGASIRVLQKCGFKPIGEVIDPEDGLVCRWERTGD
jgi:ADP-ribosyl-[dinitrogen reductase] hydrolase